MKMSNCIIPTVLLAIIASSPILRAQTNQAAQKNDGGIHEFRATAVFDDSGVAAQTNQAPQKNEGRSGKGDPKRDIEIIEDATRIKLMFLANATTTPGIAQLDLSDVPSGGVITDLKKVTHPPAWAGKFDDQIWKTTWPALRLKYQLDQKIENTSSDGGKSLPKTGFHQGIEQRGGYKIDSNGSLNHIGTRSDGNDVLVYMDMGEWADIITVSPPSPKLLPVKLKSGLMTMRLPSMEVSFEEGAVCSVNGNMYTYRSGHWTPNE
jgi:hypothetical protein